MKPIPREKNIEMYKLSDVGAECALLGAILNAPDLMQAVWYRELKTTDFYHTDHQKIFGVMLELYEAKKPIDLVTVTGACSEIQRQNGGDMSGYLADLYSRYPDIGEENVLHYARILKELASKRQAKQKITILQNDFDHAEIPELLEKLAEIQDLLAETIPEQEIETLDMFLCREKAIAPYIVQDILPAQGYMLLAGATGEGKTTLAMQLCLSVLTGMPFFGLDILIPDVHILYLNFENSEYSLHKLLEGQLKAYNHTKDQLRRLYVPNCEGLDFEKELNQIQKLVKQYHIELVVVDPITWGMSSDPNDYRAVLKLIKKLKHIHNAENNEISWLLVHHFKKPSLGNGENPLYRVLGSTGWVNCATSILTLERYAETRNPLYKRLDFVKLRDAKPKDAITIAINEQTRCFEKTENLEAIGTDKVTKILSETEKMTYTNLVKAISQRFLVSERTAKSLISKALNAKLVKAENGIYSKVI